MKLVSFITTFNIVEDNKYIIRTACFFQIHTFSDTMQKALPLAAKKRRRRWRHRWHIRGWIFLFATGRGHDHDFSIHFYFIHSRRSRRIYNRQRSHRPQFVVRSAEKNSDLEVHHLHVRPRWVSTKFESIIRLVNRKRRVCEKITIKM